MGPYDDDVNDERAEAPTEPVSGGPEPTAAPPSEAWLPPAPAAGSRSSGAFGAIAALVVVVVLFASIGGYLVGRRANNGSSASNGAASSGTSGFGNNANGSGGSGNSTNGNGFGGFGNFGPSTGNGSSASGSDGSSSSGSSSSGTASSASAQQVASKVNPAIVDVTSTLPNGEAKGTGMVITSDGEILTNDHVISGATSISVQFVTTGKSYAASIVGYDASHDVALLKISNVSGLTTIQTSNSNVNSGQNIVVIGNAYGQDGTPAAVDGTVAATNKTITASDETGQEAETLNGLIELSANVVSGDSGGAVADTDGHVIAMTTAAWAGNGPVSFNTTGDAYAIPINTALSVAHDIENGNESSTVHLGEHGLLGVGIQDGNGGGAAVVEVQSGSAAAAAGLTEGDTITAVNGTTISSANDLNSAMGTTHVGDKVTLQWQDANGSSHQATVTLNDGVA